MMSKYSRYAIDIFVASALAFSAQTFLLIPEEMDALTQNIPYAWVWLLSVLYLYVAYLIVSSILLKKSSRQYMLAQGAGILLSMSLAAMYFHAKFTAEGTLLIAAALAPGIAALTRPAEEDRLQIFACAANALVGAALIFFPESFIPPLFRSARVDSRILSGIVFLLFSLIGTLAWIKKSAPWVEKLSRTAALPWILWAIASIFPRVTMPAFLPAFLFVVSLLIGAKIPWEKVILREDESMGHFIFPKLHLLQAFLLLFLSLLLYLSEHSPKHAGDPSLYYFREGRILTFVVFSGIFFSTAYAISIFHIAINMLMEPPTLPNTESSERSAAPLKNFSHTFLSKVAALIEPFLKSYEGALNKIVWQERQIHRLNAQLESSRVREHQNHILNELRSQLDAQLDEPVAAQLVVNAMQKALNAELAAIFMYDAEMKEAVALASAGEQRHAFPVEYRQSIKRGVIGRAIRTRKTQIINNTALDPDYFSLRDPPPMSEIVTPLVHQGICKGVLLVNSDRPHAFSPYDVETIETAARELIRTWEQVSYDQRLTRLIQTGIRLSSILDPETAIQELAAIAKKSLQARFTFVTLIDQNGDFTRVAYAGYAPRILKTLSKEIDENPLMRTAFNASFPFRVRDVRKHALTSSLRVEQKHLRSLLVVPIRLRNINIGAILAFGKRGGLFFSEKDESLANLLSSQAGAAIESAWLVQELQSTVKSTTLLYQLSIKIIQANTLQEAARTIIETAHRLTKSSTAGIVLFTLEKEIHTILEIDENGVRHTSTVPLSIIEETLSTGKDIIFATGENTYRLYIPIQTPLRKYGVLWISFQETEREISSQSTTLQTLANQAAIALERTILISDLQERAEELRKAYQDLENSYDQTLSALMSALDARDRETEGHSSRVSQIACAIGKELGLPPEELRTLQRGALLHDIGKIGISDAILHKPGPLSEEEWEIMKQHPDIGVKIVENIPFLRDTLPIIRYHQERWDGSGYPIGLQGKDIPLHARIFALADVFDALTGNRPYRKKSTREEALQYITEQSGILFDPELVEIFKRLFHEGAF